MSDYVTKTNVLSALARFKENTDALYGTKADANDMKSEINQHEARLQNLEQKAGDYVPVQYRGTNAVPTGKASYGLVEKIVGKTRAWNQLAPFPTSSNVVSVNATVNSVTNGQINFTATAREGNIYLPIKVVNGHKYLVKADIKNTTATTSILIRLTPAMNVIVTCESTTSWQTLATISAGTATANSYFRIRDARDSDWDAVQVKNIMFIDLTLIFGADNEPSTVEEALAQLPALGQYNAYDAGSLVDTTVTGVEAIGVNIFDEQVRVGTYDTSSGAYDSNVTDRLCSKNAIAVKPNTTYYFKTKTGISGGNVLFYDRNNNFISASFNVGDNTFTTPANASFVNLSFGSFYGTTYNNDIQICLNSYADKTTYHPFQRSTLMLSEPVTLKSAGAVAEVLNVETGKKTKPINSVDLSDLVWDYNSTNAYFYATLSDMKVVASGNVMPNFTSAIYEVIASRNNDAWADAKDKSIGTWQTTSNVCFKDLSKTASDLVNGHASWLEGMLFNYELATPDEDEQVCDPIIDNTIYTEGGGTIDTIQTQSPVIDNCLDVGYLAV